MFELVTRDHTAEIRLETTAYEGVKRVAAKVAEDVEKVSGKRPVISEVQKENRMPEGFCIFVATVGNSPVTDRLLREGKLAEGNLKRDREVYSYQFVGNTLFLLGSDKRGTIYGLFHLSEQIGVSPLCYFGDAAIVPKQELFLERKTFFSREPSVKYRGFFINDEWPAFGNWVTEAFGDTNAKAYDVIFELLLRMKGNYLWPAMWNSSFSQDGPGLENARLADIYGVIMGTSHHEPLCRAGVEWQRQYRQYGKDNTWSFLDNRGAITTFWEDGVERNKAFENVYTIGMRGESDSKLLPEDATMADNVAVVKEAILAQDKILAEKLQKPLPEIPRMLAVYKEVEQYYYGDETCQGLKDWEELKDVIFLLSDDNHGNLRALPTEEERKHPGGFGMYYHVDYHGGPISYEWINSTKISKIWEQMTTAYEHGVRSMWIVNVGDLKGAEYPLSFFMDLAYDYETYGIRHKEVISDYPEKWVRSLLGTEVTEKNVAEAAEVLNGFVAFNAVRRPEYTNAEVYHPTHYGEGQWVIAETERLLALAGKLHGELPSEAVPAYESCIYYPALASLHLHAMNALAGYNHLLAERGSLMANRVGDRALEHLQLMEQAVQEFHKALGGKWNHMMDSAHTGFRSWDDYNWTYPTIHRVTPIPCAKALVGFLDSDTYHLGAHWQAAAPDICRKFAGQPEGTITIAIESRGSVDFTYKITADCRALLFDKKEGQVKALEEGGDRVQVTLSQKEIAKEQKLATISVKISFADGKETEMPLEVVLPQKSLVWGEVEACRTLTENKEYLILNASDYAENHHVEGEGFEIIPDRGRWCDAAKCFPPEKDFLRNGPDSLQQCPCLGYAFALERAQTCQVILELVPANPDHFGGRFAFFYGVNHKAPVIAYAVAEDYNTEYACREWDYGVVNHVRRVNLQIPFEEGKNELRIYPGEPGLQLERILILPEGRELLPSYLGPGKNR